MSDTRSRYISTVVDAGAVNDWTDIVHDGNNYCSITYRNNSIIYYYDRYGNPIVLSGSISPNGEEYKEPNIDDLFYPGSVK